MFSQLWPLHLENIFFFVDYNSVGVINTHFPLILSSVKVGKDVHSLYRTLCNLSSICNLVISYFRFEGMI